MESAVQSGFDAAQRDQHAGVAFFNGASVLIKANRNWRRNQMLETVPSDPGSTEEAPAFAAHVRLARLRSQAGDLDGARQEQAAALAFAREYKPAQDLKF